MIMLCIFLFIAAIAGLSVFLISWLTHITMNKDEDKPYDWCTFKTFIKEFDKYKNNPKLYTQKFGDTSIFF